MSIGISGFSQADKVCPPVKRDLDNLGHYQSWWVNWCLPIFPCSIKICPQGHANKYLLNNHVIIRIGKNRKDNLNNTKRSKDLTNRDERQYTSFLPVKSAAAFTLPRRWILDANWVVITLPLAAEMCLSNESATTVSLSVLPGERTFVESLIIWKKITHQ